MMIYISVCLYILILSTLICVLCSLRAPIGYQDSEGFHYGEEISSRPSNEDKVYRYSSPIPGVDNCRK